MGENEKNKPTMGDFFANLLTPLPTAEKIRLFIKNNLIKLIKRQSCCGHPGEPGC